MTAPPLSTCSNPRKAPENGGFLACGTNFFDRFSRVKRRKNEKNENSRCTVAGRGVLCRKSNETKPATLATMPTPVFTSKINEAHTKAIASQKGQAIAYRAIFEGLTLHEGKSGGKRLVASIVQALEAKGLPVGSEVPKAWRVFHCKGNFSEVQVYTPDNQKHSVSFGWENNTVTPDMIRNAKAWAEGAEKGLADLTSATKELPALEAEFRALVTAFLEARKAVSACNLPHAAREVILADMRVSSRELV